MTKSKKVGAPSQPKPSPVVVEAHKGETEPQSIARVMLEPYWRHGFLAKTIADKSMSKVPGDPQFIDFATSIKATAANANTGDLKLATNVLVAQAQSLDAMFAEYARRSALNMGDYINASEIYGRLALKAQANCRATLEALMKLHQPREQTVKHVHVNEGGQAVVADHFHQHGGSGKNGRSIKQSHATGNAGDSAALPSPDPEGNGMSVPGRKGEATMPNARRDEPGAA